MNITTLLLDIVKRIGTRTAIIENGREISYHDLWDRIEKLSVAFHEIGIKENHRVALILPNSSEFIYCFFALLKINAIVTPLSPDCTPYELKGIFNNLNPYAIIAIPKFIEKVCREYPGLLDNKIIITPGEIMGIGRLKANFEQEDNYAIGNNTENDQIATINYTYRGWGYPLGVISTQKNYVEGVSAYIKTTQMDSSHRVLSLLPLSKIYPLVGCMLAPLICGATVVISTNYMPKSVLKAIDNFKINRLTAVPSIYKLLLQGYKKGEYDLGSLTCCITGGAYMSPDVQENIESKMGLEVLQGYGLTECFVVSWNRNGYNEAGTLGLPFRSDIKIRIVDENGEQQGIREVGEVIVNTPCGMRGYYKYEEETREVLRNDWHYTGDFGYLDEKGYLYFVGLKKKIAKVGGNIVDFEEIRNVLLSHSAITDAMVSAKDDDLWGHVVVAEIVSQVELTENDIKTFCGKSLSSYKVPKEIKFSVEVSRC